jgi:glyoxylase-like metal-dependent hydrolase (beta-lactamase superfamily II)
VIGNPFVCETWQVKNAAHRGDESLMEDLRRQAHMFDTSHPLPKPDFFLEDGDSVTFGEDVSLHVLHIPGHSPGSIALYSPVQNWIISGDALYKGTVGRTDIPCSDFDLLIDSIKKKMMTLPPETVVYPGHGKKTTIGLEKEHNPFVM